MYIQRAIEKTIVNISKNFPVLFTGLRQVGKTTLRKNLAKEDSTYGTLDDPLEVKKSANPGNEAFLCLVDDHNPIDARPWYVPAWMNWDKKISLLTMSPMAWVCTKPEPKYSGKGFTVHWREGS